MINCGRTYYKLTGIQLHVDQQSYEIEKLINELKKAKIIKPESVEGGIMYQRL